MARNSTLKHKDKGTGMLNEEAFFFENERTRLFGMIHLPSPARQDCNPHARAGFVLCHPFADEAFRTHREMVVYARHLAEKGYAVIRFDCRGCGDSEGDFHSIALSAHVSDIRRAVTVMKQKCEVDSIGLLGLRFGAALAAAAAAQDERVNALILWAPIVDGGKYFQFLLQSQMAHELGNFGKVTSNRKSIIRNLEQGGSFDLMANRISSELYRDFLSFDPWLNATHTPEHVAIISLPGARESLPDLEALKKIYPYSECHEIQEKLFWFDKIFQNPSRLYETTSRCIEAIYP
jgi:pimeloyl-ACP methyl ester carboxylesterase